MSIEIPWSFSAETTSGLIQEFNSPPPGWVLRLRGLLISALPYTSNETGMLTISGAAGQPAGVVGSAGFAINFPISSTNVVNTPVDFGEHGLVIAASFSFVVGSPPTSAGVNINAWGALTLVNE